MLNFSKFVLYYFCKKIEIMTVKELIEKLKSCPQDYEVTFESGDGYGCAYDAYVDDININDKNEQIKLIEL